MYVKISNLLKALFQYIWGMKGLSGLRGYQMTIRSLWEGSYLVPALNGGPELPPLLFYRATGEVQALKKCITSFESADGY